MKSRWDDTEAARLEGDLALRAYTSRLLGQDKTLVLYGGGNTSVKVRPAGSAEVLYVKGTGSDLARVTEADFVPLDLAATRGLFDRDHLDNAEMMRTLGERVIGPAEHQPSIETMLHAALPFAYVEHTHADSVLAVANVEDGERVVAEVYGETAPLVPYHHSGVELARACREAFEHQATKRTIGLILMFHGVVAFGASARESYENMLRLVTMAEEFLKGRNAWEIPVAAPSPADPGALASLHAEVSRAAARPLAMHVASDPVCVAFARRDDLAAISQQGPATPQHAFFTKRVPLIDRDVPAYAARYRDYLRRHLGGAAEDKVDPAPRIVLDAELGLCAFGADTKAAAVAAEVYRHDIEIIVRASGHGTYRAAPEALVALAELDYGGPKVMA